MKTLSNSKGFSLIELMIVVAIIGILSAVAIPNFQKFQLKSRQSEAKTNLAAIFQTQKAYKQEWGQYFTDWRDLGFGPEGTLKYDLSTGAGIVSPSAFSGYMGVVGPAAAGTIFNTSLYLAGEGSGTAFRDSDYLAATFIGADWTTTNSIDASGTNVDVFGAGAASDIDRVAGNAPDSWHINHTKNLYNIEQGF